MACVCEEDNTEGGPATEAELKGGPSLVWSWTDFTPPPASPFWPPYGKATVAIEDCTMCCNNNKYIKIQTTIKIIENLDYKMHSTLNIPIIKSYQLLSTD
jgi:hypothetical protein